MSEPSIPPLVAWMSRHGVKVLGVFILIELAFHAWAVRQSREMTDPPSSRDSSAQMTVDSSSIP